MSITREWAGRYRFTVKGRVFTITRTKKNTWVVQYGYTFVLQDRTLADCKFLLEQGYILSVHRRAGSITIFSDRLIQLSIDDGQFFGISDAPIRVARDQYPHTYTFRIRMPNGNWTTRTIHIAAR